MAGIFTELEDEQGPIDFYEQVWPAFMINRDAQIGIADMRKRKRGFLSSIFQCSDVSRPPKELGSDDILPWGESVYWTASTMDVFSAILAVFSKADIRTGQAIPELVFYSAEEIGMAMAKARSYGHPFIACITHDLDYLFIMGPEEPIFMAYQVWHDSNKGR
jgi:hypothetical protein